MSSQSIKINGSFEIPEPVELDKSYDLTLRGGVTSISKYSEENGEFSYVFNLKPEFGEVTMDKGKTLKLRKKGSQSQRLRADILSRDLDYEGTMSKIITHLDALLEVLDKFE